MGEQCFGTAGSIFDPGVAALSEWAVTSQMIIALRLRGIEQLFAGRIRPIEGNGFDFHERVSTTAQVYLAREAITGSSACSILVAPNPDSMPATMRGVLLLDDSNPLVLFVIRPAAGQLAGSLETIADDGRYPIFGSEQSSPH